MKNVWIRQRRRKAVWGPNRTLAAVAVLCVTALGVSPADAKPKHQRQAARLTAGAPGGLAKNYKLDDELTERSNRGNSNQTTHVIVTLVPGMKLPNEFKRFALNQHLDLINGEVLELPNGVLKQLAKHPDVFRVHFDRPTKTHNYRTAITVGARDAIMKYGYTGAGVGVAVIDSGMTSWHDDMINFTSTLFPYGNQRVSKFVDFVNGRTLPYDDNGHGSHVAGIIGGVGYDSKFDKAGIAPLASIVALKVLDQNGQGSVSRLIAAMNWVSQNYRTYNIRVVNMSVGAGVLESYWTDPLTLAAKALTDKGIVVVAAAGNLGKNAAGQLQWGGITAPGNAPWVLTVGASSTMGTTDRADDEMAGFSSSGPTAYDFAAKPDLSAPGVGTVSLAVPGSTFYTTKSDFLLSGSILTGTKPYLALSGTSMSAPVVSGTVALMLQANPTLTPNLVKAILQYTAERRPGYSALRQGAGFLNTFGAVQMARFFATAKTGDKLPADSSWSRSVLWGSHRLTGGNIRPSANAWANTVVWGSAKTFITSGDNIVWGTMASGDNIVWGSSSLGDNIVWGTSTSGDNIVWGSAASGDNIVWGSDCGGADCNNVVWGSSDGDNIVWGSCNTGDNIVWGSSATGDNIVWGSSATGDNIVWGMSGDSDVTWGTSEEAPVYPDEPDNTLPSMELDLGSVLLKPETAPTTLLTGTIPNGGL
jgi:serine protease AprX